jgi:crotonobetainyl-CoA:carnitine CoA-transferase CaiB-like acyl-CoA transferase
MPLPLAGLKVLDLSRLLPGPYATLLLADLGAQVDKVEDPAAGGDGVRAVPPFRAGESAVFYGLNRNKRSVALDLKSPAGQRALRALAARADVLVESFRPGVMERLGLGYASLREENPGLIYCALTGYGQDGPDRHRAGHDLDYLARSGVLGLGLAQGREALPGGQQADVAGALFAVVGILAALHERRSTGKGRLVDVALADSAVSLVHMHLAARLFADSESGPLKAGQGMLHGSVAVYRPYRTADGRQLAVAALEPKFAQGFFEVMGHPEWLEDAWNTGAEGRALQQRLEALFASQPLAHWVGLFAGRDLCVEPVREGDEVMEDPQLRARGLFVTARDAQRGLDAVVHLRTPLNLGPLPTRPPPALGQHTAEVLREAGLTDAEVAALAPSGG